jgi:Zn-dependent protease with chaperone function
MGIAAVYYDGATARARAVTLSIEDDMLAVSDVDVIRRDPIGALEIMEAIGRTPRVIRFVGGASCEVFDGDGFQALLESHGVAGSRVAGWERSRRIVLAAVVLVAVLAVSAYRWGLPALAKATANGLPPSALDTISLQIQRVLDGRVFQPTKLSGRRHAALLNAFDALRLPPDTKSRLDLRFRNSEQLGPNAMALPSGVIFVTDQLVDLTPDDRIIMAVVAHEAGHVQNRHGLRQVIQSTIAGALVTWYIGDVSSLAAAAPTALLQAKYSRDLEREADAYAARVLQENGLPVSLLIDALEALDRAHPAGGDTGALAYLSSHPATTERIAWLRELSR